MLNQQNSLLEFPCSFTIKVMGRNNQDFEIAVLSIIRSHFDKLAENAIQTSFSKNNNYLSLSITVEAENQEQLNKVYQDLTDNKYVILAL